jgi:hypothetical protein
MTLLPRWFVNIAQHCPYAAQPPPTPADDNEDGRLLPCPRFSTQCCISLLAQIDTRPDDKYELHPAMLSTVFTIVLTSAMTATPGRVEKDVEAVEGAECEDGANLRAA